ncbi:hypothetical protein I553_8272 [Mycobacterium xenopi 4042]|uniref:Uncharacterized protein n=1 Tax=Mycobacterium xenopi 4042 TaxID=1299334 RepID=X8BL20_MYCXE|nr:hypothetical protein I553_8272 [Mycobacterium xenopi 4042]
MGLAAGRRVHHRAAAGVMLAAWAVLPTLALSDDQLATVGPGPATTATGGCCG